MERVIGIDPGIRFTGVAILEKRKSIYVCYHKLIKRETDDFILNLTEQCWCLSGILDLSFAKSGDGYLNVVIERPRIRERSRCRASDQMDLSLFAGAFGATAMQNESLSQVHFVYPEEWTRSTKKNIQNRRTQQKYQVDLSDLPRGQHEHILDAIGIAEWAIKCRIFN